MSVPSDSEDLARKMVTFSRQWTLSYELMQQNSTPVISNLDTIDSPTLILIGEKDISAVKKLGEFLAGKLPCADLVVIPKSNRLLNLTNPNAFNAE